jgi:hypothetical protein
MSTESASIPRCLGVGACMAVVWFAGFVPLVMNGFAPSRNDVINYVVIGATFFGLAAGFPAWQHDRFKNGKAILFLSIGAILAIAPLFAGFVAYLLSSASFSNHR